MTPLAPERGAPHRPGLGRYGAAIGLVVLANAGAHAAGAALTGANLAMLFLLSVLVSATVFGIGPALTAAFLAALTYNFFFLEPHYTFRITHPADLLTFLVFFAVAMATGWLAGRARDNERRTAEHAQATATLLDASRALAQAATPDEAAQALAEQVAVAAGGRAIVLLRADAGLRVIGAPPGFDTLDAGNLAAAERVWAGTAADDAAPSGDWIFRPLDGVSARVGVIGLRRAPAQPGAQDRDLIGALLEQGGVVIERALLASAASENEALRRADQLRMGLLNSISHDFRTPLASILGSATTLSDYDTQLKPAVRRDLLDNIQEDAQRLNRFIGALLDMSRLEGGALKPNLEQTDVRELVGSALRRLGPKLAGRRVETNFPADLALVRADPVLLEQAILNVLDNAAGHTPSGAAIRVSAFEEADRVCVAIEDEGTGIPPEALDVVFERFKQLGKAREGVRGLGLGLSITKGFVEAMGGTVSAASSRAPGGGARFVIGLPTTAASPGDGS